MDKKKKIIIIGAVALLVVIGLIVFLANRGGISATTMRVIRIEGNVSLQDNGVLKAIKENLRLLSGNTIDTSESSTVSIGLDDTKIVTMDELSRAEFKQSGKQLNLDLTAGSLFFEVDKPLADDESFEIETSTMIVGIRGTSGWVSVQGDVESFILTDGHVHIIGTNPTTGERKEIDVNPGQRVTVYLYNDRSVDSIMFEVEDITEREAPEFILGILRENMVLLDRVCEETGWDKNWILGIADAEPEATDTPDPDLVADVDPSTEPSTEPSEEPVHEHEYVAEVTKPATCGAAGEKTFTCECGDSYTEVIPATGNHTYVAEVTTEANCVLPGVMTYTCSVCGDTYTEVIPATGEHTFEGGTCQTPMICSVCGAEGPMGSHHFVLCHHDAQTHQEPIWDPWKGNLLPPIGYNTVTDSPAYDDYLCEYCGCSQGDN
jgi:hypothetical protein